MVTSRVWPISVWGISRVTQVTHIRGNSTELNPIRFFKKESATFKILTVQISRYLFPLANWHFASLSSTCSVRGRLKECPSHSGFILTIPCSGSLGNAFQAISHFRLDRDTSCYWNAEHSLTEQTDEEHLFQGICFLILEGQVTKKKIKKKLGLAFRVWQNGFTAVGFLRNLSLYKSKDSQVGNLREHIFGQK